MKITQPTVITQDTTYNEILEIQSSVIIDPDKSITITMNNQSILVAGKLTSRPNFPNVHTIRFTGINENNFVGKGDAFLDSDKGLWVLGAGVLDIQGSSKTGWTNIVGGLQAGASIFTVKDATGWQVGDEIVVTPTKGIGVRPANEYEERKITAIIGNSITVDRPFVVEHPTYTTLRGKVMTPEIINLTRTVRIEGTPTGFAHTLVKSTAKQEPPKFVQYRYMGPRKDVQVTDADGRVWPKDGKTELVVGRYAIHYHHAEYILSGTKLQGCVVRDSGNHSFVIHGTHEVELFDCAAYNVHESAYFWDYHHNSHGITWRKNIAARFNFVSGALNEDRSPTDDVSPRYGASGFLLGVGDNNKCLDCVCVGSVGDTEDFAAFDWDADNDSPWLVFTDNIAHNNDCGNGIWHITQKHHIIERFISYNNTLDHFQGAYGNSYINKDADYNTVCVPKAQAQSKGQPWLRMSMRDLHFKAAQIQGDRPTQVILSTIHGKVWYDEKFTDGDANGNMAETVKKIDIINSDLKLGDPFLDPGTARAEVIRVQPPTGQAFQITHAGKQNIARFAPDIWGTGDGLKGEYFTATGVKKLERIDFQAFFDGWYVSEKGAGKEMDVDYRLGQDRNFKVKWTGFIEGQYSEEYTFVIECNGKATLKINSANINLTRISRGTKDGLQGKAILTAGVKTPIEINYQNDEGNMLAHSGSRFMLFWKSPSLAKMIAEEPVPMSQLYSGTTTTPPIDPPPPTTYKNTEKKKVFNCPSGTTGNPYTYIVPAGKYSSTVSQLEADQKADTDISDNGQIEANKNLVCTPVVQPPTPTHTAKAKLTVDIISNIVADYRITNYGNTLTKPYREGKTLNGILTIDITDLRGKAIYLFVGGKRVQKV